MKKGKLIVISGPSGVGKTTLYKKLLEDFKDSLSFSISATTRKPRKGEIDGKDYYFISKQEFLEKIKNNEFLEWTFIYDNYYGTLFKNVNEIINNGKNCLLDVDVQGGTKIKMEFKDSILIFIAPPSFDELKKRIEQRKTDTPESIKERITNAERELNYSKFYDYIIINDTIENAYNKLKNLISNIINNNIQ